MTTTIAERVAAGAAWLDEHEPPGWVDRVDPDTLNLGDCWRCVLGQLRGEYFDALDDLGLDEVWGDDHGFSLNEDLPYPERYAELTAAWRDLISTRRAARR